VEVATSQHSGAVLVVDDEPAVGVVLGRVLGHHAVTVVTKAKAALALVASGIHFDVIVSDLMMPEMSGMQLYTEIARQYPAVASRIVFMTGGVVTPEARAFLDRVPNERISKPFDHHSVNALVQRLVGP
jgi:CheY-like chemotaxis protein